MFKSFKKALDQLDNALAAGPLGEPKDTAHPGAYYAVKMMNVSDKDAATQVQAEIDLLRSLPPHPNIMKFVQGSVGEGEAVLVTELVDGGSLADRLISTGGQPWATPDILHIMSDVASAVAHLHAQQPPITHRDLKLENVLFDRTKRTYKLCDFGSCVTRAKCYETAQEIAREEEIIAANSTLMYRAPEMVDLYQKKIVCEKVDVWALGCLFYTLCYGVHPFQEGSSLQILSAHFTIPTQPAYPPNFEKLIRWTLNPEPTQRPDIFLVLEAICRLTNKKMDPALKSLGDQRRGPAGATLPARSTKPAPPASSKPAEKRPTTEMSQQGMNARPRAPVQQPVSAPLQRKPEPDLLIDFSNPNPPPQRSDLLGDLAKANPAPQQQSDLLADLAKPPQPKQGWDQVVGLAKPNPSQLDNGFDDDDEWGDFKGA